MEIAKDGFFRWIFWAMFSWHGRMNRLPYLGASLISAVPLLLVMGFIYWAYAVAAYGSDAVARMSTDDFLLMAGRDPAPFYLSFPLVYVSIAMAAKRLRSMNLPPAIAAVLQVVYYFSPIEGPVSTMMSILMFAYFICLLAVRPVTEGEGEPFSGFRPGSQPSSSRPSDARPSNARPSDAWPSNARSSGGEERSFAQERAGQAEGEERRAGRGSRDKRRRHVRIRDWRVLAPAPRRDDR